MKKGLRIMTASFIAATMFAGCTAKAPVTPAADPTAPPPTEAQTVTSTETPQENESPAADTLFKDKKTIEVLEVARATYDVDNMVQQKINEYMNADVIYTQLPETAWQEQYGVILASRKLPDVVNFPNLPGANEWIAQGAVIPLDDLLDTYGQDIKSFLTDNDYMEIRNAADEQIYTIPALSELKEAFTVGIREDWLANVNKSIPKTLEEYKDVLIAFRDGDPNKNGKKDEVPYAGRLRVFENAFGIKSTDWQVDDGKYVIKYEHKNYLEYLAYVKGLFEENLIDKEYYTRNTEEPKIDEIFFADLAGTYENWAASTRTYTETLREKAPEAKMIGIDAIIGPYGNQQIQGRARVMSAGSITSTTKQPEVAMQYLNWFFGDQGLTLTNYGVEGETFDVIDGKKILKPEYAAFEPSRKVGINKTVGPVIMTVDYYQQCLLNGKTPEDAGETFQIFYDALFRNTNFIYTPDVQFATPTKIERGAEVIKRLSDAETQCIIGNITIDQFKEIRASIKNEGLDQITKEMNEVYDKVK